MTDLNSNTQTRVTFTEKLFVVNEAVCDCSQTKESFILIKLHLVCLPVADVAVI